MSISTTYDLDQYDCLCDHKDEVETRILEILREHKKVIVHTRRRVYLSTDYIVLHPCCLEACSHKCDTSYQRIRLANGGGFVNRTDRAFTISNYKFRTVYDTAGEGRPGKSRFKRSRIEGGFEVSLLPSVHKLKICDYTLAMTVISSATAEIQAKQELTDPTAEPVLKCHLHLTTLRGRLQKNKRRIVAQLEDGVFYWKGKELDAINNKEVAQLVTAKMQEISQ